MDRIMNTFRDKQDQRIVMVVWLPEKHRFELYWLNTVALLANLPAVHIRTFPVPAQHGMTEWTKHKAQVVTMARGLASMNDTQFDRALRELSHGCPA